MINKNSYIEDIVEKYPQLVLPLRENGIVCIACGEAVWGTIGQLAEEKNITNIDEIIDNMNQLIKR